MDEKYLEQADALTQSQRDDAMAEAHRAVNGAGQEICEDCGEEIPASRRIAYPAAMRCFFCQHEYEQRHRRLFI